MQKTMTFGNHRIKICYSLSDRSERYLNPILIRKQKLTYLDVRDIIRLHKIKDKLFEKMKRCDNTEVKALRNLASQVTVNEYALQKAWKFRKNKIYHKFWELPHCTCPKMDNDERYPSNYGYYINGGCILHGTKSNH